MGVVNAESLQVIDIEVMLENCPIYSIYITVYTVHTYPVALVCVVFVIHTIS